MKFKLIMAMVEDGRTDRVTEAARAAGATGCTVITSARGEGLAPATTFFGLTLEGQRDIVLLIVEEHLSRKILESISEAAGFETVHGAGMAFQIDIEDAVGLATQIEKIQHEIEDEL